MKNMKKRPSTNVFVGEDYKMFLEAMLQADEDNELPVCLGFKQEENASLKDFKELATWMKEDADLQLELQSGLCPHCNRLHTVLIVDRFKDDGAIVQ